MSINDQNGNSIIRLGDFHAAVFKLSLYVMPIILGYFVNMVLAHDKLLDNHTLRIGYIERSMGGNGKVTQNVNVGANGGEDAELPSAKTWLTTQQVAERENVTDRTVLNYIEAGMIEPEPEKLGKEWHIAEHYRIVLNRAEECGIENE